MLLTRAAAVAIVLVLALVAGGAGAVLAGAGATAADIEQPLASGGAGSPTVMLSDDAAVHPAAAPVLAQLQRHYDAINTGDYAGWAATVADARSAALTSEEFAVAYRTTKDGTIRIDRIDDESAGGLLVRVRFVSTQDEADAPADMRVTRICWRSTLPMEGTPPRISPTQGGSSVRTPC